MSELMNTIMNLFVFAFIGLLVWLYFREPPPTAEKKENESRQER